MLDDHILHSHNLSGSLTIDIRKGNVKLITTGD